MLQYSSFGGRTRGSRRAVIVYAQSDLKVAITGATGLVGARLVNKLSQQGAQIKVLTRDVNRAKSVLREPGIVFVGKDDWESAIPGCTGVVNLAGEPIATRWSDDVKKEILNSRVNVTKRVVAAINACPKGEKPEVLVSSSAIGYYGVSPSGKFTETSTPGSDFLARVCLEWEGAAKESTTPRTVILRTGIVLAKEGGALARMLPVFQLFSGGPLGSGSQWCSWIHRDDLVGLMLDALSKGSKLDGAYNATAPTPVRMSELCSALGTALGRPSWLPVPDFALQALLGEGAMVVLEGQQVLPQRTQDAGYKFSFPTVDSALQNILR